MPDKIILESVVLTSLRLTLFFSCRRYLLKNLYHDLQDLSAAQATPLSATFFPETPTSSRIDAEVELELLPAPSIHSRKSRVSGGSSPLHSSLARTFFSLCFSESCILFVLLLAQGLNAFDPRTRMFNWRTSMFLLLATILVFIPISLSLVLSVGAHGKRQKKAMIIVRLVFNLAPVALYLFLLSYIPLPSELSSNDAMTTVLSRLVVLGTVILGALSGFGAISNAWAFFPLFSRTRNEPTDEGICSAELGLQHVRDDLAKRRVEMRKREASQPKSDASWLSRVVNFRGDGENAQELKGLEALEYQMSRNLEVLKQQHEYAKFSRSFKGRIFNWGGRMFAIYCVFRVISSIVNIFKAKRSTASYPDIITHFLAYLLSLLPSLDFKLEDIALLSRQISLGLVGIIILTSVRLVLRGVTRALRITSRKLGASMMLFILAQLMGIYLLSTVVQLRTSFPPPPSRPDLDAVAVNLFSTIPEYEVFGSLFDWSFLFSAGATALGRWLSERVNGV